LNITRQGYIQTGIDSDFSTVYTSFFIYNNNLTNSIQRQTLFSPLQGAIIQESQTANCSVSVPIVCASTTTVSLRYSVEVDLSVAGSTAKLIGGTGKDENELLAVCTG